MRGLFLRSLILAFVTFAVIFGLEFFIEWHRAGYPGVADMSWAGTNNAKLADILSPTARAYNNVLAMLIATIGLAIPLTANMHTPKLIELFLQDRINRWVLSFMAAGAAHTLWVTYIIGPKFAPTWAVGVAVMLAIIGWAILIPYFFYVVRFLDPSRVVIRLRDDTRRILDRVADRVIEANDGQNLVAQRIGQLGTITIKSLQRDDRDVAREAVWAIKQLLDHYANCKSRMPKEWHQVDRGDFVGFSYEAIEMLSENKTWFEMKCLQQLELGFMRALSGAHDTVSTFSDALRVIAVQAQLHHQDQSVRLCIRFFNNYLREAIKARNLRAVYDVFQQYRRMGRELVERPDLLREISKHFLYYAGMARLWGLVFAPQLAVFDLGYMTRRAFEANSPAGADLLRDFLSLPHRTGDDVHKMAVKAKLILGAFLLENKRDDEASLVRENLADVEIAEIARSCADLLDADRTFFEVTDRQVNLEYMPPERREPLQRFCASLDRTSAASNDAHIANTSSAKPATATDRRLGTR